MVRISKRAGGRMTVDGQQATTVGPAEVNPPRPDAAGLDQLGKRHAFLIVGLTLLALILALVAAVDWTREKPDVNRRISAVATVLGETGHEDVRHIDIRFLTTTGAEVTTQFGTSSGYRVGQTIRILYDALHPSHVVPASDSHPLYPSVAVLALLALASAAGIGGWAVRWRRTLLAVAGRSGPRTAMVAHAVGISGVRRDLYWVVALWDPGASSARPRFQVLVTGARRLFPVPTPVQVIGSTTPGAPIILEGPDGLVWPSARLARARGDLRRWSPTGGAGGKRGPDGMLGTT
jgi:hypothetical protein